MYLVYLMCESYLRPMDHLTSYQIGTCDCEPVSYANNTPNVVQDQEYCHCVHRNNSIETVTCTEYSGCSLTSSAPISSSSSCSSLSRDRTVSPGQANELFDILQPNDSKMKDMKERITKPKADQQKTRQTARNALIVVKSGYFTTQIENVDKVALERRESLKDQLIQRSSIHWRQETRKNKQSDDTHEAAGDSLTIVNVSSVANKQTRHKPADSDVSSVGASTLQSLPLTKQISDSGTTFGSTVLNDGEDMDNQLANDANRSSTRCKPAQPDSAKLTVARASYLPEKGISRKNSGALSPEIIESYDISQRPFKKRIKIRKSLSKIHKKLKTKLIPPPEESEGSVESLTGSEKSGSIDSIGKQLNTNGFCSENEQLKKVKTQEKGNSPKILKSSSTVLEDTITKSNLLHHCNSSPANFYQGSSNSLNNGAIDVNCTEISSQKSSNKNTDTELRDSETTDNTIFRSISPTFSNFHEGQLISPSMGIAYHPPHTLEIQNSFSLASSRKKSPRSKHGSMRKKKKSGSWYNAFVGKSSPKINKVLSPSYKQKNDDFHKFFKELPSSERLLVDYNCAFVKDILIQGRLYASQNYLCFHSNILKWQTAVTVKFVEIDSMTKEKTVKVIPNAIQFILKDKTKMTFTSFTARDRAYIMTFRLWQNALLDKPMSPTELWTHVHSNYGEELGLCSSDDDYVKPHQMPKKHQSIDSPSLEGLEKYEFGTTNKVKKKKKQNSFAVFPTEEETATRSEKKLKKSKSSSSGARQSSQESNNAFHVGTDNSTVDEKSIPDDVSEDEQEMLDDDSSIQDESRRSSKQDEDDLEEEDDDEPAPFVLQDAAKVSMSCQYETTARDMFRIIFGDDCGFWKDTLVKKHTTGTWYEDEKVKGQALRDLSYTLRLDNPIGPKTSHCKETQILYPSSIPGKTYGIDCVVQNYGIPYADYFQTCMRYCIKKTSRTSCQVRVTSEIRYKKTPWGLIKNFIEKNVNSGLSDNFKKLELQLQERVEYEKQHPNIEPEEKRSNLRLRKNKSRDEDSRKPASLSYGTIPTKNLLKSDLNNNQHRSREGMSTFPSLLPPNGYIPNSSTDRMKYSSSRLMFGTILFIFLLLLYSNYSMYQRLTTLEQVTTAAATADGVDPSVTAALLDRPGVSITENPELLATYLQAIDKRLRRLETAMLKYAEDSNSKWSQMQSEWSLLHIAIDKALKQKEAKQKPLVHHP